MQKSTGKKLALQARRLSKEGCYLLELMNEAEASVYRNVNLANYRAWHFGKFLARAKAELGHGRFTIWRAATFPNVHERKAQRCQELFAKNSKATVLSDLSERSLAKWIADLNENSVRKFRLGYVPEKERLQLPGDEKVKPAPHYLTFVNEFFRYDRQLRIGKIEHFDLDLFRHEIEPVARRLIQLCGPDWFSKLWAEEIRGKLR